MEIEIPTEIDYAVIGAGIGGLNCAAMLALAGKKVAVFEKLGFLGGRCASYQKNGYTVDYGVHAFANGKNGPLHTPIKKAMELGVLKEEILQWNVLNPVLKYKNDYIRTYLPLNFKNLIKTGISFMKCKVPLKEKKMFLELNKKFRSFSQEELKTLRDVSVKELIDRYTDLTFPHVMMAISSDSYSVVPYSKVSAMDFVEVYKQAYERGGISYPVGGCGAIPQAYKTIIETCGCKIFTNTPVESIIIEEARNGPKVEGIKLAKSNKEIKTAAVVSNVDWKETYRLFLKGKYFSSKNAEKIESLEHSYSSVVAHIALDKKLIDEKFVMKAATLKPEEIHKKRNEGEFVREVGCFMPITSNVDSNLAPPGKQLALAGIGTTYSTSKEKDFFTELILDNLQELVKNGENIRDHIEWMDVKGPKELEALFGERGSIIGLAQQIGQVRDQRLSNKTEIEGLYHCGDDSGTDLFGVGTELAALSGQKAAKIILAELNLP
jgi:phytoene dehydrogenase-like protein